MMEAKVLPNRRMYLGFSILDLYKITMYRFHYQQIIANYVNKAKLAYTDTDSFVYLIETKNIYDDMAANIDAFDTSEYLTITRCTRKGTPNHWGTLRISVILFRHTNLSDFEARYIR